MSTGRALHLKRLLDRLFPSRVAARERQAALGAAIEGARDRVGGLADGLDRLTDKLDRLAERLDELTHEEALNRKIVERVSQDTTAAQQQSSTSVAQLAAQLEASNRALLERLSQGEAAAQRQSAKDLAALAARIDGRFDDTAARMSEMQDVIARLAAEVNAPTNPILDPRVDRVLVLVLGLTESMGRVVQLSEAVMSAMQSDVVGLSERVASLRSQSSAVTTTVDPQTTAVLARTEAAVANVRNDVAQVNHDVAEARLWLEKISTETQNAIAHLDGRGAGFFNRLEVIGTETSNNVGTRFNRLFNEDLPKVVVQVHDVASLVLQERAQRVDRARWKRQRGEQFSPANGRSFEDTMVDAGGRFPEVILPWTTRLEATADAFAVTKEGNAANVNDVYSRLFKSFVELHVQGRVLDVGCGVFGVPYYLERYPIELISGIEPLPTTDRVEFERVRGIGEFLPWPDHAFSTVINATSLDHAISLERSLAEMSRVLTDDGVLILWIGSIPGAAEYTPQSPSFVPADQFHLFHFDVVWFEPLIERHWKTVDRLEFPTPSFTHVFYALKKAGSC